MIILKLADILIILDIDECKQPGTCHENAICTNTPGHFLCQCMDGFTGDGVTECIASFLFPHEGHQELPKSRNAKVSFTLKDPLLIFGKPRNKLIVSALTYPFSFHVLNHFRCQTMDLLLLKNYPKYVPMRD